nr:uncharacterized protein LOC112981834 isoform X2 [Dromaius novaehollandiae]
MDEEQYFTSEENIPLSSRSWLWKKRNFISPAAKSQSKTEAWVQTVIPSVSQVPEDAVRSDAEPKSQTTIHSSVPLPGSVIDYSDEMQEQPSCVIKSVMTEEEPDQNGQRDSWLHRLGISTNKWSFLNSLIGWSEYRATEKDQPNTSVVCSADNHKVTELEECWRKEELSYIPYKLAKSYIAKIVEDMQQMKVKHMKIIKELDNIRKENQVILLKH